MTETNQESGAGSTTDQSPTQDSGEEKPSDPPMTLQPPRRTTGGAAQTPSLGRTVIVREDGKKDAPGIVAEVFEDTISCNVFRADHLTHVATHLTEISAESGGSGWFWPPRV